VQYIRGVVDDPLVAISYDPWENVPPVSDHAAQGFQVISEAVTAIYPEAVVTPSLLTATTDTRHYIDLSDNQYRFHGAMMPSSQAGSIHGTNEFIDVQSYENCILIAREMLLRGAR
jgi:carboxypeptidase PM20D1